MQHIEQSGGRRCLCIEGHESVDQMVHKTLADLRLLKESQKNEVRIEEESNLPAVQYNMIF